MESEDTSSDDQSANESSSKTSGGGNGTTKNHGGTSATKAGRKGDARMHRAVGARLANPKISLFDALQIGGFDYVNDDDANAVDSEQITLAQRKNQLSRRIRLAQKSPATHTSYNNHGSASKWPTKMTSIKHFSGQKRRSLSPTDTIGQSDTASINSTNLNGRNKIGRSKISYHIRARQHPDYHPLMIGMSARESVPNGQHHNDLGGTQGTIDALYGLQPQACNPTQYTQNKTSAAYPPSSVAVTSLSQSAASLGMTLEQLALTLRSSNNLSKLIDSGPTVTKQQKQLALSLYQNEIRSTYQRVMLLAGYKPDIVQNEQSPEYMQFVIDAWHMEGARLSSSMDGVDIATTIPESVERGIESKVKRSNYHQSSVDHRNYDGLHDHAHDHKHNNTKQEVENNQNGTKETRGIRSGRHIHRLEGKCGHQPVLHQPTGGKPHIDFVIGDRVECYHNIQPSQDLLWQSNYNCEDLSCSDVCGDIRKTESASNLSIRNGSANDLIALAPNFGGDPKIYDRNEINFESDEWNFDFAAGDSLLGLFKLGDPQPQQQDREGDKLEPNE